MTEIIAVIILIKLRTSKIIFNPLIHSKIFLKYSKGQYYKIFAHFTIHIFKLFSLVDI